MNNKLNCIFLGSFLYPNGYAATKRKQQFLDYLLHNGAIVRVLLTLKVAKGHELNNNEGMYRGVPYSVIEPKFKKNIFAPFFYFSMILKALYLLISYKQKSYKNIIVAFGFYFDTVLPLLIAKLIGYKIVFDVVEDFTTNYNSLSLLDKVRNYFFYKYDKVFKVTVSNAISVISISIFKSYQEYANNRTLIRIIPISADNVLQHNSNGYKKKTGFFTFLYSGTYGEKEGLPFLFSAFKELITIYSNAKLILTGNCPEKIKNDLKERYGLFKNVVLTGKLDDEVYYDILNNADALLMTRKNSAFANAGFPYKLGEYLATGNPVITTKVSDIGFYLKDKENAILVKPENSESLLEGMKYVIENEVKANEIGKNGREISVKYFNPLKNSKKFFDLLCKC